MTPLLIVHIAAGGVALVSGFTALAARKGSRPHRQAGNLFFASMLAMGGLGAVQAALGPDRSTAVGGLFTCYLVASAWMTVRRPQGATGRFERWALFAALALGAADLAFGVQGATSPRGRIDGMPFQIPIVFGSLALLAAAMDARMLRRGGISGVPRIARHIWRMCLALFIASGSFFLGQQKVMPEEWRGAPILFVLALAPLGAMVFWLIRVRVGRAFKRPAVAAPA